MTVLLLGTRLNSTDRPHEIVHQHPITITVPGTPQSINIPSSKAAPAIKCHLVLDLCCSLLFNGLPILIIVGFQSLSKCILGISGAVLSAGKLIAAFQIEVARGGSAQGQLIEEQHHSLFTQQIKFISTGLDETACQQRHALCPRGGFSYTFGRSWSPGVEDRTLHSVRGRGGAEYFNPPRTLSALCLNTGSVIQKRV
ncbi:hypothetical protein CEXT_687791 [Caerostris extrusa]|uniref:Uncharacterized protein n=1 Tax=Caerostris extrusa TaxID=172846 RepID=A0AAV4QN24_CAEEX|nr:hypothetical protein CEXT_687791 [Caerostris extrusa]